MTDAPIAMQNALQVLIGLQEIDRDIYQVQRELERLPAEREARRAEIDRRIGAATELRDQVSKLRSRIKELEDHATIQRQRLRKVENQGSGSRVDVAMLAAYQHEARSLRREISKTEEEALELLEKVETVDRDLGARQEEIRRMEAVFEELAANVAAEIEDAEGRLRALRARRDDRSAQALKPADLELYARILEARGGIALAQLEGAICQGCYMEVPPNLRVRMLRGAELIQCPSCDRILYP